MYPSIIELIGAATTYLVFGIVGYRISKKMSRPVKLSTWIILVVATIASGIFMVSAMLLVVGEFKMYWNNVLQAIGVGMIIGLATRELKLKHTETKQNAAPPSSYA